MVNPVVDAVQRLDRRFITTSLVPTSLFTSAYLVVLAESTYGLQYLVRWWAAQSVAFQLILTVIYLNALWFASSLLSSNWRKIVRLYEGYPLRRFINWLAEGDPSEQRLLGLLMPGVAYHVRRRERISGLARPGRLSREYASDKYQLDMLPTALGNCLLAAERYALDRYRMDINVLWPRLFRQMPESAQRDIELFKEEHQIPVALSFVSGTFAVASGLTIAILDGSSTLFSVSFGLGGALALFAYWLSLERTREYGEQLRSVVDLYHDDLFRDWSGPPFTTAVEASRFERATAFVTGARMRSDERQRSVSSSAAPGGGRSPARLATKQTSLRSRVSPLRLPGPWRARVNATLSVLRLSHIALMLLVVTTYSGARLLSERQADVLVVTVDAPAGTVISDANTEWRSVRRDAVGDSIDGSSDREGPWILTNPLRSGDVVAAGDVIRQADLVDVSLPVLERAGPSRLSVGEVVGVLFSPCGAQVERAVVRSTSDPVTVSLRDTDLSVLAGCELDSMLLIPRSDQ